MVTTSDLTVPAGAAAETTPTGKNKIKYKTTAFFRIDTLDAVRKTYPPSADKSAQGA